MVILLLLIGVLTLFYVLLRRVYSFWERKGVPVHPGANLICGHLKKVIFQQTSFGELLKEIHERAHEPVVGIYSILHPMLLVCDPELIQSILVRDFAQFTDRGAVRNDDYDPLSAHLFALEGSKWKSMRARLSPAFTAGYSNG